MSQSLLEYPLSTVAAADAFVGRQPIYDRDLNLVGHELVFRSGNTNSAALERGEEATSQLVLDAFLGIGFDRVSEGVPVFLSIPRTLLPDQLIEILPPARCVLELSEDVLLDESMAGRLATLREAGYVLALDNFVYSLEKVPALDAVSIVKLAIRQIPPGQLAQDVESIRQGRNLKILADKIDTLAEYRQCRDLGFDLFQGYFLSRPEVVPGRRAPVDLTVVTTLLQCCEDPLTDTGTIAQVVSRSPSLSYKLLQAANSSMFTCRAEITSLQDAVSFLGTRFVARLAALLLMAGVSRKPEPCLLIVLQRACMCERLTELVLSDASEEAGNSLYMMGLLSGLDILLDQPLEELIPPLPLPEDVKRGIVYNEGRAGRLIQAVSACQQNNWDAVVETGLDANAVYDAYWESLPQVAEARERITGPQQKSSSGD